MTANEEPYIFSENDVEVLQDLAKSEYVVKEYRILSACALPKANVKTVTLDTGTPSSTTLRHLATIEGAGLITRLPCEDKRMRMLAVTAKGAELLQPIIDWYRVTSARHRGRL